MSGKITINFDESINSYIVRLPDVTTLQALKQAKKELEYLLENNQHQGQFSLLLDTGTHEFESIECLKYLRSLLSIKPLVENCTKFASVAPASYAKKELRSDKEASFNDYSDAYNWLQAKAEGTKQKFKVNRPGFAGDHFV